MLVNSRLRIDIVLFKLSRVLWLLILFQSFFALLLLIGIVDPKNLWSMADDPVWYTSGFL